MVNQLVYLVFQVTIGLSHAASISVGGEVAVGRTDAAARVSRLALIHGAVVMAIVAVVYLAVPGIVLRPFLDPADSALGIATSLLMIAALMQFFDCAQNIGVGLLRGVAPGRAMSTTAHVVAEDPGLATGSRSASAALSRRSS